MSTEAATIIPAEPTQLSSDVLTPTKTADNYDHSHLPFPVIAALVTFLTTASAACNLPEAVPYFAAGGTATTLIFAAENVIHRRIETRNNS